MLKVVMRFRGQWSKEKAGSGVQAFSHYTNRNEKKRIEDSMKRIRPHFVICFAITSSLILLGACTTKDNPDEIRRQTAQATETMRRDTKAVVDGVKEGLKSNKNTININKASQEELLSLPGVSDREADRIVAERPFDDTHDLVKRRIISQAEYDRIQDRIIAGR